MELYRKVDSNDTIQYTPELSLCDIANLYETDKGPGRLSSIYLSDEDAKLLQHSYVVEEVAPDLHNINYLAKLWRIPNE